MCIYKVHFVHRARILLCILIFQKELFSLLCFALHCCMLSSGPYFVQSAGISRWSAALSVFRLADRSSDGSIQREAPQRVGEQDNL